MVQGWSTKDIPAVAGKYAVVTGTGGLGLEVAKLLAQAGAQVVMAGRNAGKGEVACRAVKAVAPEAHIQFLPLDLASLASVAGFSAALRDKTDRLDILVNNAGIMAPPNFTRTADGFELQFGTNYLGHFALTAHCLPLLKAADSPRVVSVTSAAYRGGRLFFDDLQTESPYVPFKAYSRSKLAQLLFAFELDRRSRDGGWGITSNAAHPGYASTDLFSNGQGEKSLFRFISAHVVEPLLGQSAADGALPILYAATCSEARGGELYGPQGFLELKGRPGLSVVKTHARDEEVMARLWELSESLAGVTFQ